MSFEFNKDYKDLLQVEHLWADYWKRFTELESAGRYPYNKSFEGHIPGAVGGDEGAAIYLLQKLRHVREDTAKLTEFIASGAREVTELDCSEMLRGTVAEFGWYMDGTGFRVRDNVRIVARNGRPYAALPKGARTRGFLLEGRVFIREAV